MKQQNIPQNTVKGRLIQFINHLGISPSKFERNCGLSNGFINNIRKSIRTDTFDDKIAPVYPQLNKTWLLLGEGHMLIDKTSKPLISTEFKEPLSTYESTKKPPTDAIMELLEVKKALSEMNFNLIRKDVRLDQVMTLLKEVDLKFEERTILILNQLSSLNDKLSNIDAFCAEASQKLVHSK